MLTAGLSAELVRAQDAPRAPDVPEPAALQAALALEKALVQTIASAEKSVVAIARVAPGAPAVGIFRPDPFRPFEAPLPLVERTEPGGDSPSFFPDRFGTGVVVESRGLIVTNYHVVADHFLIDGHEVRSQIEDRLFVWTSQRRVYPARVRAADPRSDLCVIELIGDVDLPAIKLGDATKLKKGNLVIALGNPYAIARDGSASASWGMIANLNRKLGPEYTASGLPSRMTLHHFGNLIQTDAKLSLGASGGALLNLQGEMVGLTSSLAALSSYEQSAGFAIPVDDSWKWIVDTMKEGKEVEYGFLGVEPEDLLPGERLEGKRGVRAKRVYVGLPGDAAGLVANDVVVQINGRDIFAADDLIFRVGAQPVETKVVLTVLRGGRLVNLPPVKLAKFPTRGIRIVTNEAPAWRGARLDYCTADERKLLNPQFHEQQAIHQGSVLLTKVLPGSPAHQAGLRSGQLVTHVENRAVHTPAEFRAAAASLMGVVHLRIAGETEPVAVLAE